MGDGWLEPVCGLLLIGGSLVGAALTLSRPELLDTGTHAPQPRGRDPERARGPRRLRREARR